MPGFDGTGPAWGGPGTGRGAGYCGAGAPWRNAPGRRLFGRGPGRGGGWGPCRWWVADSGSYYRPEAADEKAFLKDQAEQLKAELTDLEKRMAELENGAK
jgi:hypothetical protein